MNHVRRREAARRSLFGRVDQEQLRRDLSQRLREITEEDSRQWNFDFQSDTPLPGRFQWEEVPAGCAATFYLQQSREKLKEQTVSSNCKETEQRLSPREEEEEVEEEKIPASNQENCPSISNTRKCAAELTPVLRKRTRSKSAAKPSQNYARITDFFVKRRRSTETKSVLTPVFPAATEAPVCRTIR